LIALSFSGGFLFLKAVESTKVVSEGTREQHAPKIRSKRRTAATVSQKCNKGRGMAFREGAGGGNDIPS
jgi:hypothetical protein